MAFYVFVYVARIFGGLKLCFMFSTCFLMVSFFCMVFNDLFNFWPSVTILNAVVLFSMLAVVFCVWHPFCCFVCFSLCLCVVRVPNLLSACVARRADAPKYTKALTLATDLSHWLCANSCHPFVHKKTEHQGLGRNTRVPGLWFG